MSSYIPPMPPPPPKATHPLLEHPYAVVDIETTGLDQEKDRIVQIAVVQVTGGELGERWSSYVNPGMPIPEEASRVHGIFDTTVASSPSFAEVSQQVARMAYGRVLI